MLTDIVLRRKGLDALTQSLGILNSERFISLILSEPFDYTEWQKDLYGDMPLEVCFPPPKSHFFTFFQKKLFFFTKISPFPKK
jgi:hypothetical protein